MSDYFALLGTISRAILLPAITLGVIGNICNVLVLVREKLRKFPSSHYFLAMAINNLFGSAFVPISDLLRFGHNISLNTMSIESCRLIRYLSDLCAMLALYFTVIAAIDRFLVSSSNINNRRRSSIQGARCIIIAVVLIFAVFNVGTLVLIEVDSSDRLGCAIRPRTVIHRIYPMFQIVLYIILAPILMSIFGCLTIYNIRQARINSRNITNHRKTELQLSVMLSVQVGIHLILNVPLSVLYLYYFFAPSELLTPIFQFIFIIARFVYQFTYATPFFLYIITGCTFRHELFKLFKSKRNQRRIHPSHDTTRTIAFIRTNHGSSEVVVK